MITKTQGKKKTKRDLSKVVLEREFKALNNHTRKEERPRN
jgi:hypothetical protein